jgi:tRNA G37 N-methylase TrmD
MSWHATVLTLFPGMFPGPLGASLAGRALEDGLWRLDTHDIRAHGLGRHRTVDDTPFGGGAGMVMRPDVITEALTAARPPEDTRPLIYLTPRGRLLTQADAARWAAGPGLVLLCGRYEGLDQRVIEATAAQEISVGDYVLSGGEPAALVLLPARPTGRAAPCRRFCCPATMPPSAPGAAPRPRPPPASAARISGLPITSHLLPAIRPDPKSRFIRGFSP